jgi:hypothetical protein
MLSFTWLAPCCLPRSNRVPKFQSFKDIHVATLLSLEQKGGLPDIGTSAGRFSLGDLVLRPIVVVYMRIALFENQMRFWIFFENLISSHQPKKTRYWKINQVLVTSWKNWNWPVLTQKKWEPPNTDRDKYCQAATILLVIYQLGKGKWNCSKWM